MIHLKSNEISAIYLKHYELIKNAYNQYKKETTYNESSKYILKLALFNYDENKTIKKGSSSSGSRKRSRCNKILDETELNEMRKIEKATNTIIDLLKVNELYINLQKNINFISLPLSSEDIEKIFSVQKFEKFKGENLTNIKMIYEMNNNKYLIPPKCKFFNYDIHEIINNHKIILGDNKYDLIIIDPPWKNKYIRRIKKFKQHIAYDMLENDVISNIPIKYLTKSKTIVCIWCTNSKKHQNTIIEKLLPSWNLKLVKKLYWIKLNKNTNLICRLNNPGQKQPYECLFIATTVQDDEEKNEFLLLDEMNNEIEFIVSIPSIIHSHKPPLFEIFKRYLPEEDPKCLELFARYLYPNFTSIGLEVLKLMDIRFYDCSFNKEKSG